MKVLVKRKITNVNEGSETVEEIKAKRDNELAGLDQRKIQLQNQINSIETQRINIIKKYASAIQNAEKNSVNVQNAQNNNQTQQNQNNVTESIKIKFNNLLFEGKNIKHDLLSEAINDVLSTYNFSYTLSNAEIKRFARKFNDIFNENKDEDWQTLRIKIKDYLLKHSKVSLSQIEINEFLDALEDVLSNDRKYGVFETLFTNTDEIYIEFNDDTDIDELENEIADINIDIIDEDLENNILTISNVSASKLKELNKILSYYNLPEIN